MNFTTAVKTCFQKYFVFKGRARRSEYWYWILFTVIAALVLALIEVFVLGIPRKGDEFQPLSNTFTLITFIPSLAVTWRRLHDIDRSGWWYGSVFLGLIAFAFVMGFMSVGSTVSGDALSGALIIAIFIGIIAFFAWAITLLVFCVTDTKRGDNRFGPDPKYGQETAALN